MREVKRKTFLGHEIQVCIHFLRKLKNKGVGDVNEKLLENSFPDLALVISSFRRCGISLDSREKYFLASWRPFCEGTARDRE